MEKSKDSPSYLQGSGGVFNDHRPVFRMHSMVIDMYIDKTLVILGQLPPKKTTG